MGNYGTNGTDGMDGLPDFGGEKGMKNVFDSFFPAKPRRESDPKRKVGRDELTNRFNPPASPDGNWDGLGSGYNWNE